MSLILWATAFLYLTSAADTECIDLGPVGKLCFTVATQQCFNLNVGVKLREVSLFNRAIPIGSILQAAQTMKGFGTKFRTCQTVPPLNCSACIEATEIKINPTLGTLLLCVKPTLSQCRLPIPIPDLTQQRCINITDCQLFGCQNECSGHGTCGTLGCNCTKGYYGVDCSVSTKDNCIVNANRPDDKICWTPQPPRTCADKVTLDVTAPWVKTPTTAAITLKNVNPEVSVPVLPCIVGGIPNNAIFKNCTYCVDMKKLSFEDHKLSGCPVVKLNCFGSDIVADMLECGTIAESPYYEAACAAVPVPLVPTPSVPGQPVPTPESDDSKSYTSGIYIAIIVIAVVTVVLATGAYFAWMHYKDRQSAGQIDEQELSMSMSSSGDDTNRQSIINDQDFSISDDGSD